MLQDLNSYTHPNSSSGVVFPLLVIDTFPILDVHKRDPTKHKRSLLPRSRDETDFLSSTDMSE